MLGFKNDSQLLFQSFSYFSHSKIRNLILTFIVTFFTATEIIFYGHQLQQKRRL
jgi:hypothetical protein